jgi:hypothetical protein
MKDVALAGGGAAGELGERRPATGPVHLVLLIDVWVNRMALPNLSLLSTGDSFSPTHLNVRYSLTAVVNHGARWMNATKKRLDSQGADPTKGEKDRIDLIDRAVLEFATYRRWLLVCAAPPLAFTDDQSAAQVRMLRALASIVDSLEGGSVRTLSSSTNARYESLLARYQEDVKTAVATMKQFDDAEKRISANEKNASFGIPHEKRQFSTSIGETGEFGAGAAASGRERDFQTWLHKVAMLTQGDAVAWLSEVFSQRFDGNFSVGCLYTGVRAVTQQDLTVEHVLPKDWCLVAEQIDELVNVTRDSRLVTLASATANSSRGTRALSLVTQASQRQLGDVDGPMSIERVKRFLYDHHNFDATRKAFACRQTVYGFLLSPLLSDARKYAGSVAGDQLGSWLTWVQWKYAQHLMYSSPPTDFESLIDWVRYYFFGGSNPLVHDANAFANYRSLPSTITMRIEELLDSRMHGTDALSRLMLDEVTARSSIGEEADAAEAQAAKAEGLKSAPLKRQRA